MAGGSEGERQIKIKRKEEHGFLSPCSVLSLIGLLSWGGQDQGRVGFGGEKVEVAGDGLGLDGLDARLDEDLADLGEGGVQLRRLEGWRQDQGNGAGEALMHGWRDLGPRQDGGDVGHEACDEFLGNAALRSEAENGLSELLLLSVGLAGTNRAEGGLQLSNLLLGYLGGLLSGLLRTGSALGVERAGSAGEGGRWAGAGRRSGGNSSRLFSGLWRLCACGIAAGLGSGGGSTGGGFKGACCGRDVALERASGRWVLRVECAAGRVLRAARLTRRRELWLAGLARLLSLSGRWRLLLRLLLLGLLFFRFGLLSA